MACYDILHARPCVLDAASLNELRAQLSKLGRHYQWLAVYAMDKGQTKWHIVPKFLAVLGHLGQRANLINPRCVQGYMYESMVGVVTTIMAMCMNGPYQGSLQKVVLSKYRVGRRLLMSQ